MAYAAVISLLKTLDELQHPDQLQTIPFPISEVQHLQEKLLFLKDFLEWNPSGGDLEVKIRDAMYEAEDVFDSNLSNFDLSSETRSWSLANYMSTFSADLQRVLTKVDSIAETAVELNANTERPSLPTSTIQELSRRNLIVGREPELDLLTNQLTLGSKALETVSIFGVSGIGKTRLAETVYTDPDIASKFILRAWVKVSLEYSKKEILLGLLRSMSKLGSGKGQDITEDELAKRLSRILRLGKYLIVLDDVCTREAWDNLVELFPDYNHGSRVMLTTRRKEVAESANNGGCLMELSPLNEEESWSLLQNEVFPYKSCPNEIEDTARRVSAYCRGLPFALVNIAKVLMEASAKDWKIAASSLSDCGGDFDKLKDTVMSLNYKSLRQYAKACLLYMGIFPNNYEIPVSKLLKLWIAEGFIEKMGEFQSLENMAEECLSQLVKRVIILVSEQSPVGKIRTCRIDGVYYEFLKKKAEEEKFFLVVDGYTSCFPDETWNQGRFCILKNIHFAEKDELKSKNVRSLLFDGVQEQYPLWVHLDFKLLRVLDALKIRFYSFPDEILKLVHLRYLALSYNGEIPESICGLWNLQFLIVLRYLTTKVSDTVSRLPKEIWNMNELRHLRLMGRDLPDDDDDDSTTPHLENLVALLDVSSHSCTAGILRRVPNLKKLGVRIESPALDAAQDFSFLAHLIILEHLESFKCVVVHPDFSSQIVSSIPSFPNTLTKLSLSGCGFPWDRMKVIAALPKLQSLKLRWYAFRGSEWKQGGDDQKELKEFPRLKYLLLEDLDIELWKASSDHFPLLTNLVIRHCYRLQEIPSTIGKIVTLKKIELGDCNSSTVRSALKIKEDQPGKGYVQVDFHSSRDD